MIDQEASVPRGTSTSIWIGVIIVAGAAAVLSFAALRDLALMCGFGRRLAWLLPVAIDVGTALGSLVWLGRWAPVPARRYARGLALTLLSGSVAGNALGHGLAAYSARPHWLVVVAVSAVAPVVLACVVHLAVRVGQREPLVIHPMIDIEPSRQGAGDDAGEVRQVDHQVHQSAGDDHQVAGVEFGEPPAYDIHLVHPAVEDEAPDQATPGAGGDDQPPGEDLAKRAGQLIDDGIRQGAPIGRPRLARELGISEYQARQLLATHLASDASDPGDDLANGTEASR